MQKLINDDFEISTICSKSENKIRRNTIKRYSRNGLTCIRDVLFSFNRLRILAVRLAFQASTHTQTIVTGGQNIECRKAYLCHFPYTCNIRGKDTIIELFAEISRVPKCQ